MRCAFSFVVTLVVAFLLVLPAAFAAGGQTYTLSDGTLGGGKTELVAQVQHSTHVVTFFTVGHKWLTFSRHKTCFDLGPRAEQVCVRARSTLQGHLWLRNVAGKRLLVIQDKEQSAAVIRQLQHGLAGTPLYPYASRFEQAGKRWNVNPFFMAAISGTESSFGVANSASGNAWGIGPGIPFGDFGTGIDYLARMLATNYNLSSTDTVGARYAGDPGWPSKTSYFMGRFGASGQSLYYPRAATLSA